LPGIDDPWGSVRTLSLSSSPSELGELAVTCKITDSPFRQALSRLPVGAPAQVIGPLGDFFLPKTRRAVVVVRGIGITPFRGMFRFAAVTGVPTPMVLLCSARVTEELVFRKALDSQSASRPNLEVHSTVSRPNDSPETWPGRVERIDAAGIAFLAGALKALTFYIVGLPEMVEEVVTGLQAGLRIFPDHLECEMFRGF
jgi:ferredoxin-NADP reductase